MATHETTRHVNRTVALSAFASAHLVGAQVGVPEDAQLIHIFAALALLALAAVVPAFRSISVTVRGEIVKSGEETKALFVQQMPASKRNSPKPPVISRRESRGQGGRRSRQWNWRPRRQRQPQPHFHECDACRRGRPLGGGTDGSS